MCAWMAALARTSAKNWSRRSTMHRQVVLTEGWMTDVRQYDAAAPSVIHTHIAWRHCVCRSASLYSSSAVRRAAAASIWLVATA